VHNTKFIPGRKNQCQPVFRRACENGKDGMDERKHSGFRTQNLQQ
jgi:hypothetical protein